MYYTEMNAAKKIKSERKEWKRLSGVIYKQENLCEAKKSLLNLIRMKYLQVGVTRPAVCVAHISLSRRLSF